MKTDFMEEYLMICKGITISEENRAYTYEHTCMCTYDEHTYVRD